MATRINPMHEAYRALRRVVDARAAEYHNQPLLAEMERQALLQIRVLKQQAPKKEVQDGLR